MAFAAAQPLDVEALRALRAGARAGARIGGDIRYFDSLESTNTTARELAQAGAPEGVVVIAEAQTRGRGRLGRSWVSPPYRNLYMSVLLRPHTTPADAPQLALVAGLATARAIAAMGAAAQIKWPNDVLIGGRKVAGILTEMECDGDRSAVVVGIGVNVNLALDEFPEELRAKGGSLGAALGRAVPRHELADRLLSALEQDYDRFSMHGFAALRDAWNQLSCLSGRWVEVEDGTRRVAGSVLGLGDDGSLALRGADGAIEHVVAGDVTVVEGYARG